MHSGNRFHPEVEDRVIISLHFPTLRRHLDRESSNGNQAAEDMAIRLQRGTHGGLALSLKQLLSVIIHEIGLNILDSSNSSKHMYYIYIYLGHDEHVFRVGGWKISTLPSARGKKCKFLSSLHI